MAEENKETLWWWISFILAFLVVALCLWLTYNVVTAPSSPYMS